MKVLILSDADSIHTLRWVRSLSARGCNILLFNLLIFFLRQRIVRGMLLYTLLPLPNDGTEQLPKSIIDGLSFSEILSVNLCLNGGLLC